MSFMQGMIETGSANAIKSGQNGSDDLYERDTV